MRICVIALLCALAAYGQATDANLLVQKDGSTSSIASGCAAGTNTCTVDDGTRFAVNEQVYIEGTEKRLITGISGNTLTFDSNLSLSHSAGNCNHKASEAHCVSGLLGEDLHNRLKDGLKKVWQTGTSAPSNPCALAGELYTDTSAKKWYRCPANGDNWVEVGVGLWSSGTAGAIYYTGGNVGIGTSSPKSLLDINGATGWLRISSSETSGLALRNNADTGSFDIRLRSGSTDLIMNGGKVLIGSTTDDGTGKKLQVTGGISLTNDGIRYADGTTQTTAAAGGSGTFQSLVTDLKPTNTSTVLTIAAGRCAGTSKSAATATITAGSGNGSYAAYCTDTQAIVVEHSTAAGLTITCSGCTASQVTTPSIPFGMQPIATGSITTGAWGTPTDARNGIDLAGHRHQNGAGMAMVCESGTCLNQVNTATVQMKSDNYAPVADFDASAATKFVLRKGTSDPATCTVGEKFFNTTSNTEKTCTAANTWTTAGGTGTASANGVYLQISGVNYLMPGMYAATLPSTTGFTWTNQASATATADSTTGYALVLNAPGGTAGWHIYKKSLGATTKVTVAFACYAAGDSGAQSGCGVGVSASGTSNALEMLRLTFHNSAAPYRFDTVSTYTNPTSFNANLGIVNTGYLSTLLTYAQVQLSGGTLTFRTSPDGTNWTDRYSGTAVSDLGTAPTEWWVGPLAGTGPAQMIVYSMKEE